MRNCIQPRGTFCAFGILLLEYLYGTYYWDILLLSFSLIEHLLTCSVELRNWTHFAQEIERRGNFQPWWQTCLEVSIFVSD